MSQVFSGKNLHSFLATANHKILGSQKKYKSMFINRTLIAKTRLRKRPWMDYSFTRSKRKFMVNKSHFFQYISDAIEFRKQIYLEDDVRRFFLDFDFVYIQNKIINIIMRKGKKALARFLYKMTIFLIRIRMKKRYKYVIQQALLNVCPFFYYRLEFKSGRIFKFPTDISSTFKVFLGIKYMVENVKKGVSNFYNNFANLVIETSLGVGEAIKRKKDLYKMLVDFRSLHRFKFFRGFPYFRFRKILFPVVRKRRFVQVDQMENFVDYFTLSYIRQKIKKTIKSKKLFFKIILLRFKNVKRLLLSYFFYSFFFSNFNINSFRFNVSTLWGLFSFLRYATFFNYTTIEVINPRIILQYMFYVISINSALTFNFLFKILVKLLYIFQYQFLQLYRIFSDKYLLQVDAVFLQKDLLSDLSFLIKNKFVLYKYNQIKNLLINEYYSVFFNISFSQYSNMFQNIREKFSCFFYNSLKYHFNLVLFYRSSRNLMRELVGFFLFFNIFRYFYRFLVKRRFLLQYIIYKFSFYKGSDKYLFFRWFFYKIYFVFFYSFLHVSKRKYYNYLRVLCYLAFIRFIRIYFCFFVNRRIFNVCKSYT